MLNQKIQDAFNKQFNAELLSSNLYLSMSAYFESHNLRGVAHWMRIQASEEHEHAMKFFKHIHDRRGRVFLSQLDSPKAEWASPSDAFDDAYKHECKTTNQINDLVNLALSEKDHASNAFLQWFVEEQVEEEASLMTLVEKLQMTGDTSVALFMIDRELGRRTHKPIS